MLTWLRTFETVQPFSRDEAWLLFRLAAIGEACGWTLLISGILCKRYLLPGNNLPVLLAGQTHGMLFLAYLVAGVGLYPSLGWNRRRAFIAVAASVPPYGSLLFEQWAARARERAALRTYSRFMAYLMAVNHGNWASQPSTTA